MAFWDTVLNASDQIPYGRRLVPVVIDENARTQPNGACFSIQRSENLQDGFRDITWRVYANAINKTAHFIQKEIGRSASFETVMYLGYPDLRAFIVLIALMKTGHKALFSSYHNSLAAHSDLIRQTDCTLMLYTAGFPVATLLEKCRIESVCLPELEELLDDSPCEPFVFSKSFEEAKHDPCFVVHTSGSTGMPKPILWTHWSISTTDNHHLLGPVDGRPVLWASLMDRRKRSYCGWPIFHGSGLGVGLMETTFNNTTIVIGPPHPVTASIFNDMLEYADIDTASCLPSTLEEVAERPEILAKLSRLSFIIYVGGSLTKCTGDAVAQHTSLFAMMASTETNAMVQHATDREDWAYVCLNPTANGIDMRPIANLFELVYVRKPKIADFQGIFKAFPHLSEYSMHDLYSCHPTKAHHWKHEGRKDDIIVLKSGWKCNPLAQERIIASHPKVKQCVMLGTARERPAAIIELLPEYSIKCVEQQNDMLEAIWPCIEEANNVADSHSQLERRYIMFAKGDKPFETGLKGSVKREATIEAYSGEIEELYRSITHAGLRGLFQSEVIRL